MSVLQAERVPRAYTPRQNREYRMRGGVGRLPERKDLQKPYVVLPRGLNSLGEIPETMPLIEELQQQTTTALPEPFQPASLLVRAGVWMSTPTGLAATTIAAAGLVLGGFYLASKRRR